MEVINDLLNYNGYKIIQRTDGFNFSLDSVLLANFATLNGKVKKVCELGCGNGAVIMMMSTLTKASIVGIDILETSCDLATRSIEMNKIQDRIEIIHDNFIGIHNKIGHDVFDLVVCNPPYFSKDEHSNLNESKLKQTARHEIDATLDDVLKTAKILLKNNGYFAMVHRPNRLVEIISKMQANNIEPKRIRFVYPKLSSDANLILIEGRRNGNKGIVIESPLYTHNESGEYSDEVIEMFGGGEK